MELLIISIVVNSLASQSVRIPKENISELRTLSNLEAWLMAKEAVMPIPELSANQERKCQLVGDIDLPNSIVHSMLRDLFFMSPMNCKQKKRAFSLITLTKNASMASNFTEISQIVYQIRLPITDYQKVKIIKAQRLRVIDSQNEVSKNAVDALKLWTGASEYHWANVRVFMPYTLGINGPKF